MDMWKFHTIFPLFLLFLLLCVSQPVLLLLCLITYFSYLLLYSMPCGCPAFPVPSLLWTVAPYLISYPPYTMRPHGSNNTCSYNYIQTPIVLVAQILTNFQLSWGHQARTVPLKWYRHVFYTHRDTQTPPSAPTSPAQR